MSAWVDLTLMSLTFFLSILWNIEVGVITSLVISLLLVVHRSSKPRMTILVRQCHPFYQYTTLILLKGRIPGTDRWKPVKDDPEAEEPTEGTLIVRIRENLDFGMSSEPQINLKNALIRTLIANTAQLKGKLILATVGSV